MAYSLKDKLVVGISSRALFDLEEANRVFATEGLQEYRRYQRRRERKPLRPGTGFPLVKALLHINELAQASVVEVLLISRNDADSGLRIFNSIEHHGLVVERAAFTDGRAVHPYLETFGCNLFLSADPDDVRRALEAQLPAALVLSPPEVFEDDFREVRIAFDADAVLFSDESEQLFQSEGLEAFQQSEAALANVPLNPGPFKPFLVALSRIQALFPDEDIRPIRTALVTARSAPAHLRVIKTLRKWRVRLDESFFLGGVEKAAVLAKLRPHIFFDDQRQHLEVASLTTPSAHVLSQIQTLAEKVSENGRHEDAPRKGRSPRKTPKAGKRTRGKSRRS